MADVRELVLVVKVLDDALQNSKTNIVSFAREAGVAESKVSEINTALVKSTRSTETFATRADRLRQSVQVLTQQANRLKVASEEATDPAQIIRLNREYENTQEVLSKVRSELRKVEDETEGLGEKSRNAAGLLSQVGRGLREAFSSNSLGSLLEGGISTALGNIAAGGITGVLDAVVGSIARVGDFLSFSTEQANNFETSIAQLSAITGAEGENLDALAFSAQNFTNQLTLATGQTVEISSGAANAARSFQLLGSAAPALLQNNEALVQITRNAQVLATASPELAIEDAIGALAGTLNNFQLISDNTEETVQNSVNTINVLAAAAKEGAVGINLVSEAFNESGGTARNAGLSIAETAAAVETLGLNSSLQGSQGGNALRNILVRLQQQAEANGREFSSLTEEIDILADANLNVTEKTKLFGLENVNAIDQLIDNRAELNRLTVALTEAENGLGTAGEAFVQAGKNADTAQNAQNNFNVATERLGIVVGQTIAPLIASFRRFFTVAINGATEFISVDLPAFWDRIVSAGRSVNDTVSAIGRGLVAGAEIVRRYSVAVGLVAVGIALLNKELILANVAIIRNGVVTAANTVRQTAQSVALRATAIATTAYNAVLGLLTGSLSLAAIGQRALNLVMSLNPIGLVVTAVGLLVAGFIALYDSSQTLRAGLSGTFNAFQRIVDNVIGNIVEQFDALGEIIGGIFDLDTARIAEGATRFANAAIAQFTDIGEGAADAFNQGFNDRIASELQDSINDLDLSAPDLSALGEDIRGQIAEAVANGNINEAQAEQFRNQLRARLSSSTPIEVATVPTFTQNPQAEAQQPTAEGGEGVSEDDTESPTITPKVDNSEANQALERLRDEVEDLELEARIRIAGGEDSEAGLAILREEALQELQGSEAFKNVGAEYQQALIDGINEEFDGKLAAIFEAQREAAAEESKKVIEGTIEGIEEGRDELGETIESLRANLDSAFIALFSGAAPSVEAAQQFKLLTGLDINDIEGEGERIEAAQAAIAETISNQQVALLSNLIDESSSELERVQSRIDDLRRSTLTANPDEVEGIEDEIARQQGLEDAITEIKRKAEEERRGIVKSSVEKQVADRVEAEKEAREAEIEEFEAGLSAANDVSERLQDLSDAFFEAKLQGVQEGSDEEKRILRQQFFFNRALSLAQAGINTAEAVTRVLGTPAAPVLVPIIIATGAAQAATILGAEPPSFFGGTDDITEDLRKDNIPAPGPGKAGKDAVQATYFGRAIRVHKNERILDAKTNKHFSREDFEVIKSRGIAPGMIAALATAPNNVLQALTGRRKNINIEEETLERSFVKIPSALAVPAPTGISLSSDNARIVSRGAGSTVTVDNVEKSVDERLLAKQIAEELYDMNWRESSVNKKQLDAQVYGNLAMQKKLDSILEQMAKNKN